MITHCAIKAYFVCRAGNRRARVLLYALTMNRAMFPSFDGELWIPRTMWEKRRQISGAIHRVMTTGRPTLLMSCDDYATFFSRIDIAMEQSSEALSMGLLDYLQVAPLLGAADNNGTDLSRIMGPLGGRLHANGGRVYDQVLVDDVDLIIDLRSEESAVASMYALIYALKARFKDIVLFSNPLRSEWELEYLSGMRDFLIVHGTIATPQQNVA